MKNKTLITKENLIQFLDLKEKGLPLPKDWEMSIEWYIELLMKHVNIVENDLKRIKENLMFAMNVKTALMEYEREMG